jgi:hypothetical protein
MIEKCDFHICQRQFWWRALDCTVQHRYPELTPTQDAKDRYQVRQALRGSQYRVFRFATRFQNPVKHLDLPAHGIPVELFNGLPV